MTGTWCVRLSLPERTLESVVPRTPNHSRVRVLVTGGGNPLGYVEFPLPPRELTVDDAEQQARVHLCTALEAPSTPAPPLPDPTPFASVIVCTRNRPGEIAECLNRLIALDYPNFEIVIVDNAPPDDRTRDAVQRVAAVHPEVRYVVEPTPGLSHARNRGLEAMQSQFAVYTDDDVAVDRQWLREVMAAFGTDESIGCVTGMVCTADMPTENERYFDSRASNWSSRLQANTFRVGAHDLGPLFPYTPGRFGTGANFAFRRSALGAIDGFDVALGAGTPTRGGEDLDAFVRVALRGFAISYTPRAIVWHHHRATEKQLREQMFAWGVGLGAFVVAHLLRSETRWQVLRRLGLGFAQLRRTARKGGPIPAEEPRSDDATFADVSAPSGMMRLELFGMLVCPWYYLRSRRLARSSGRDTR